MTRKHRQRERGCSHAGEELINFDLVEVFELAGMAKTRILRSRQLHAIWSQASARVSKQAVTFFGVFVKLRPDGLDLEEPDVR